jgi:hypothetical protein
VQLVQRLRRSNYHDWREFQSHLQGQERETEARISAEASMKDASETVAQMVDSKNEISAKQYERKAAAHILQSVTP